MAHAELHRRSVGGSPRTAGTDRIVDPATGEEIATAPASDRCRHRRRGPGCGRRLRRVVGQDATGAQRGPATPWPTPSRPTCEHLSRLECQNVGKPVSIIEFEMDLTLDNWRFFASAGRFLEGKAAGEYMEGYTSMVRREPLGVVGSIAPWNYPLNMATWKVGPRARRRQHRRAQAVRADAADRAAPGRAGRRHPAARACSTSCAAEGETAGVALVEHPDVAMVSLTGSVGAGKAVARGREPRRSSGSTSSSAARRRCIVFDDADIEAVVANLTEAASTTPARTARPRAGCIAGVGGARRLRGRA